MIVPPPVLFAFAVNVTLVPEHIVVALGVKFTFVFKAFMVIGLEEMVTRLEQTPPLRFKSQTKISPLLYVEVEKVFDILL